MQLLWETSIGHWLFGHTLDGIGSHTWRTLFQPSRWLGELSFHSEHGLTPHSVRYCSHIKHNPGHHYCFSLQPWRSWVITPTHQNIFYVQVNKKKLPYVCRIKSSPRGPLLQLSHQVKKLDSLITCWLFSTALIHNPHFVHHLLDFCCHWWRIGSLVRHALTKILRIVKLRNTVVSCPKVKMKKTQD